MKNARIGMKFSQKVRGHKGFQNLEDRRERRDWRDVIRRKPLFFAIFRRNRPGGPTVDTGQKPGVLRKVEDIFYLRSKFQVKRSSGSIHFSFSIRAVFADFRKTGLK